MALKLFKKHNTPRIVRWIRTLEKMNLPVSEKTYHKAMMNHSEYFPVKKTSKEESESFVNHMKSHYAKTTR